MINTVTCCIKAFILRIHLATKLRDDVAVAVALKHAFDTTYDDALDRTQGRPYGVLVHGESDTDGALLGIQKIVTGLAWRAVAEPVSVIGSVEKRLDDCRELGAVVAATTLGY